MKASNLFCTLVFDDYLTELKFLRRSYRSDGDTAASVSSMVSLVSACESAVQIHNDLDVSHAQTLVVAALCKTIAEGLEMSDKFEFGDNKTWQKIRDWVYVLETFDE